MKMLVPISVVIPTLNRALTLERTLNVLTNKNCVPAQIVIVDQSNNEMKEANSILCESLSGLVRIDYEYLQPASSTKARNIGFRKCVYEIIIFSDDDIDVFESTILNIYNLFRNPHISLVAAIDDSMDNSYSKLGYLSGTKSFKKRKIGHVTLSMLGRYPCTITQEVNTEWAMGYFFAIRKSLMEKWALYWDEKLLSYAYAEDLDFSFTYYRKSIKNNYRCIISPQVHVNHLASKEYRIPKKKQTFMFIMHRYYLNYKHGIGLKGGLAIEWTNICIFFLRIIKNEKPLDFIKARFWSIVFRKKIHSGDFKFIFNKLDLL